MRAIVQHLKLISSGKDMSSGFLVELVFDDGFNYSPSNDFLSMGPRGTYLVKLCNVWLRG